MESGRWGGEWCTVSTRLQPDVPDGPADGPGVWLPDGVLHGHVRPPIQQPHGAAATAAVRCRATAAIRCRSTSASDVPSGRTCLDDKHTLLRGCVVCNQRV